MAFTAVWHMMAFANMHGVCYIRVNAVNSYTSLPMSYFFRSRKPAGKGLDRLTDLRVSGCELRLSLHPHGRT